jgi:zinc protease
VKEEAHDRPPRMPAPPAPVVRSRVRRVPGVPVVAARLWVRGGGRCEEHPGQAWATGRLLTEGSRRRDWRQLAEEVEDLGASLYGFGGFEGHGLGVDALAEDWRRALEWLAELALEAAFPQDRLSWMARQGRAELAAQWDQPEVRTAWAFARQLYGENPRSRPPQGGEEALDALTRDSCAGFHRSGLARGVVVAVAGEVDEEAVARGLEELLAPLGKAAAAPVVPPPAPEASSERRQTLEAGSEDQAHLYLGHLTVPRLHPDLAALEVLGVILGSGAGLTGRIPLRLREREGLAYTAHGATVAGATSEPGQLVIYAGTSPQTVERAEAAAREELEHLVEHGVTDEEVQDARTYLLGREPFRRETARQWVELLAEAAYWGLPVDDPSWRRSQLEAVDRGSVEEAARRHLHPERLWTTVGLPG